MGEVYKARDTRLDRFVAIKVSKEQFSERFDREARAVAALNHPNVCTLHDIGPNYLVMELVEGQTLAQRIQEGPIPIEEALPLARQIADALEAAHAAGITHRDLKPANVKVNADGVVKVLDFGLAKLAPSSVASGGSSEESPTLTLAATQAGIVLGTAAYMAPEQARGKIVDKRADIWAFGVVLWELITGKKLFQGEDVSQTLAAVIMQEVRFDEVPFPVRRLLRACLQRDPKKRLRDIGDVAQLLDEEPTLEPGNTIPAQAVPSGWRSRRLAWAVAGTVALVCGGLAFVHFREQPEVRQVLQYTVAPPETAPHVSFFAVSPDGRYLAVLASGDGGQQIWVRSLDSLRFRALAGTEQATYPFWSPDSRFLAFFSQNKLKKISVEGGPAQTLCDAPNARGGTWSRQGVIVFAPGNGAGGLSRVREEAGVPVNVTHPQVGTHRWPVFLPDGKRLLYLADQGSANGIYLASLDDPQGARLLVPDEANPQYLAPQPGSSLGHLLFVREGNLMAQPVDPKTMDNRGELFPAAQQIARGTSNGMNLYSISAAGMLVYLTGGGAGGTQHVWVDLTGRELEKVGGPVRSQNNFGLSPDGKRIVDERIAEGSRSSDLWITDTAHGGRETRITFDASSNALPVWSPDGSEIAFASNRTSPVVLQGGNGSGRLVSERETEERRRQATMALRGGTGIGIASLGGPFNLYQRASNGTGQDELLLESKDSKWPWDWSHDGKYIIFGLLDAKTGDDIWALPVKQQDERKAFVVRNSPFRELQGQLSPDGRWLASTSNESGNFQVYVVPFAPAFRQPITAKWQISLAGGRQPRWRGDGKALYYVAPDRKLMAVEVKATTQTFEWGTPQPLFELRSSINATNEFLWGYVPSADGKRFLVAEIPGTNSDAQVPPLTVIVNWLGSTTK